MVKRLNLTEQRFGRWLVLKEAQERGKYGDVMWLCRCDCGIERTVIGTQLKQGNSNSCGCLTKDVNSERETTHGLTRHKNGVRTNLYGIWQGIKTRCYNPNAYAYKDYGGRGIFICDEWKNNFQQFYNDMSQTYKVGLTIERKEVNKGYSKDNCVWISRSEQANNRRCSIWIDTEQGRMTIQQACKIAGISWPAMYARVKKNWNKSKLLSKRFESRTDASS